MSINKLGKVQVNTSVVIKLASAKEYEECLNWFDKNSIDKNYRKFTWTQDWSKFIHDNYYGWGLTNTRDQTHTWAEFLKEYDADANEESNSSNVVKGLKLIPGKIYHIVYALGNSSNWLVKFDKVKEDGIFHNGGIAIQSRTYYNNEYTDRWGDVSNVKDIRPATEKEIEHFGACVAADAFVDPPNKYLDKNALINIGVTAIHCETKSELDYVIEKTGYNLSSETIWQSASNKACIREDGKSWEKLDYWTDSGADIITFKTWCSRNNYDPPFYSIEKEEFKVGDIVHVIKECPDDRYTSLNGKVGKLIDILSFESYPYNIVIKGKAQRRSVHSIRKATAAEILEYSIFENDIPLQTTNVVSHFPSANSISKKRPKIEVVKKQIKKLTTIKQ